MSNPPESLLGDTASKPPFSILELLRNEVHVWYAWTEGFNTTELRSYYYSLLENKELQRVERLTFDALRLEYLVTRGLCRTVLSAYVDTPPSMWRFKSDAYGKPKLALSPVDGLCFNLSNARTLVACVVAQDIDIGIDVEEIDQPDSVVETANRFFSPKETAELYALAPEQQKKRFLELWTLKESYIKARGTGLSTPLNLFSFSFGTGAATIDFDPILNDVSSNWRFTLHSPSKQHLLAVGMRSAHCANLRVHIREVIPQAQLTWKEVAVIGD